MWKSNFLPNVSLCGRSELLIDFVCLCLFEFCPGAWSVSCEPLHVSPLYVSPNLRVLPRSSRDPSPCLVLYGCQWSELLIDFACLCFNLLITNPHKHSRTNRPNGRPTTIALSVSSHTRQLCIERTLCLHKHVLKSLHKNFRASVTGEVQNPKWMSCTSIKCANKCVVLVC